MKTKAIKDIFFTYYGNKLDLNKMKLAAASDGGISFVSRTARNLGISAIVRPIVNTEPYNAGLITVALGGAILSSNVQPKPFYTAQNIMVLEPKETMTFNEKVFYCICIERNQHRYSAFGREANITLKDLQIPETPPSWVNNVNVEKYVSQIITKQLQGLYSL